MSETATTDPDDATLRTALQALAARLGKTPTVVDMHTDGEYHPETYVQRFGSWENALASAGLDADEMGSKKIPDRELLAELQRLATELGHTPTKEEMQARGEYSDTVYQNRFGSWNNALEEAMLGTRTLSESELLAELKRLAADLDRAPRAKDMEEYGKFGQVTYHRRFGSWLDALDEADLLR